MSLVSVVMYSVVTVFFIFALVLIYYVVQRARTMMDSKVFQVNAFGAILLSVFSVASTAAPFLLPGNGLRLSLFFLWLGALSVLIYGGFLAGRAIQRFYTGSLLKITLRHPGSVYDLVGIVGLAFLGVPLYSLDLL